MLRYKENLIVPDIDSLWLAWLAGLVDGEGSFLMACTIRQPSHHANWSHREVIIFSPTVVVKMHEREADHLDHIQKTLGFGKRYHIKAQLPSAGESWQTTKLIEAATLCNLLSPYIILKKSQADTLAQACNMMMSWRDDGGYGRNPERIWELYQIRENLNPGTYRSRQRLVLTKDEVYDRFPFES